MGIKCVIASKEWLNWKFTFNRSVHRHQIKGSEIFTECFGRISRTMRSTLIASRPKNYRIPTNGLVLSLELTRRTLLSVITNAFAYPNVHFPTPHNIVGSSTNISIPIESKWQRVVQTLYILGVFKFHINWFHHLDDNKTNSGVKHLNCDVVSMMKCHSLGFVLVLS